MAKGAMGVEFWIGLMVCSALAVMQVNAAGSGFPVPSYYVFGDAYFDAGNNNFIRNAVPKANYKPYGMTFFKGVPTGRFCNGRIFADLLAAVMKLPLAPPSLSTTLTLDQKGVCVNYASGGAAILRSSSVAYGWKNPPSFDQQVTLFETHANTVIYEYGIDNALLILNDAIYQISFGTIDVLAYFTQPHQIESIQIFLESLATEYRRLVDRLYTINARKVVVFGVGPIQNSPVAKLMMSKMTPAESKKFCKDVDTAVQQLNQKLRLMVTEFNNDNAVGQPHGSLQLVFADVYGAVSAITKKPGAYGLTDVTNACCGAGKFGAEIPCGHRNSKVCKNVSKSLYWNDMQFTEAANQILFKLFFDGSSFVKPLSVKSLAKLLIPGVPY
ncbi:hypothetical protein KC19_4G044500 [Ceratodon purpureus]|uniref:GDSL esterase/lipase n=1 Tax=Ceratodon purpureus TaxID=3225 RepID=A0A8T0I6M0_CERPU|nr:hypothetical protein KC19_4G044500 [Ceratodon purpureus]